MTSTGYAGGRELQPIQPLIDWMLDNQITVKAAATLFGIPLRTFHRQLKGESLPSPDRVVRIYLLTRGAVRPDHWYQLPELEAIAA